MGERVLINRRQVLFFRIMFLSLSYKRHLEYK